MFPAHESKKTHPPWPYQSMERWLKARVEPLKKKNDKPFYPDFDNDVFAGVL